MRILIAEDEKDLNRIISARLAEEHYDAQEGRSECLKNDAPEK